jgi:hypothetical protein
MATQRMGSGGQFGAHGRREQHVRWLLHHQPHFAGQLRDGLPSSRPTQHSDFAALSAQQPIAMPQQGAFARAVRPQ